MRAIVLFLLLLAGAGGVWALASGGEGPVLPANAASSSGRDAAERLAAGGAPGDPGAVEPAAVPRAGSPQQSADGASGPRPAQTLAAAAGASERPAGALEGSLRWHETADVSLFSVTYRRDGEALQRAIPLTSAGRFMLQRAEPGNIELLVKLRDHAQPLHVIRELELPVGADSRLQDIDVTIVRRITLTVLDAQRAPIDAPVQFVAVPPKRKEGRFRLNKSPGEGVEFLARHTHYDVTIWAAGYMPVKRKISGDDTVILESAARLRVALEAPPGVTSGAPVAELMHVEPGGRMRKVQHFVPQPDRRMSPEQVPAVSLLHNQMDATSSTREFAIHEPGVYRVGWVVQRHRRGQRRPAVLRGELQTVSIAPGEVRTIRYQLQPEDLRRKRAPGAGEGAGNAEGGAPGERPPGSPGSPGSNAGSGRPGGAPAGATEQAGGGGTAGEAGGEGAPPRPGQRRRKRTK